MPDRDGQPVFVLRASDPLAPILVSLWAALREKAGEDRRKISEARSLAMTMVRWQRANSNADESEGFIPAPKKADIVPPPGNGDGT